MVNTDKACDRCGLVVDRTELLDLDTGSCCHPEPIQCIRALRAKVRELEEWQREALPELERWAKATLSPVTHKKVDILISKTKDN